MTRALGYLERIRPILGDLRTVPIPAKAATEERTIEPFITISREAGTGAWTLAQQLVEALNQNHPHERPWTCWDKELVEKVATDFKLSEQLIESMGDSSHSWLDDFLTGLSYGPSEDEARVYGRVAATIRALAQAGRVVIVGRGGVFITRKMPAGIHVRLVAPWDYRVKFTAKTSNISDKDAAAHIRQLEKNRAAFYRRYWAKESLGAENFTITMNAAKIELRAMIEIIRALARQPVAT
jgi:cytidylate kinase